MSKKRVLAIYYTQSGQLGDIMQHFTAPLKAAGHSVETVIYRPAAEYAFPWTATSFFAVMPDCVLSVPTTLAPFTLQEPAYDLVILGYQAWFLSPSIPVNSLLRDPAFGAVLKDTPVITITGARNMWINAYGRLRENLADLGARPVGTIALVDRHLNLVSFMTIFHWMFHGKKDRYLSVFPKPGVSDHDIEQTADYGRLLLPYLSRGDWTGLPGELAGAGAVEIKDHLMLIELNGGRIFSVWAHFIARRKNKRPWLAAFKYYIIIALFLLGPVAYILVKVLLKPLMPKWFADKKHYYLYEN
jgi:hypothetical protein